MAGMCAGGPGVTSPDFSARLFYMARRKRSPNGKSRSKAKRQGFVEEPVELLAPTRVTSTWWKWFPILFTMVVTFIVFIPSLDNPFVSWDDDHYIFNNHQLHYRDGIKSIWFDVFKHKDPKYLQPNREDRVSHQYYPLLFTVFWLEFRFHEFFNDADPNKTIDQNMREGKMTAFSFHLISVLMHMLNVMLLIMCFRALGLSNWVAWAATILFAIHPLQVSTVAWASERKNIMSLMFNLLSLMTYIKFRREGGTWRLIVALLLFQSALFSKTVALTLPAILFFTDRLLEKGWRPNLVFNSILRAAPFVALSCIAAWTTIKVEDRARTIPIQDKERPLVAPAVLLFYPAQMLVPTNLAPIYPSWTYDHDEPTNHQRDLTQHPLWYLPLVGVLALAGLIIAYRRKLGPHFMWGLLYYCITQLPMLGIKDINYFQFSFVAEHYFYNGSVGLFLMLALAISTMCRRLPGIDRDTAPSRGEEQQTADGTLLGGFAMSTKIATALVLAASAVYGSITYRYCEVWSSAEAFWQRTIEVNEYCWPAYYNTANARRRAAEETADPEKRNRLLEEAAQRYEKVAEIHLKIKQPFDQLIDARRRQGRIDLAYDASVRASKRFGSLPQYHHSAGSFALELKMFQEAYDYFVTALKIYHALDASGNRREMASCYEGASTAALGLKNWKDAETAAMRAAELYLALGLKDKAAAAYSVAAGAAKNQGRDKESEEYYRKATDLLERNAGDGVSGAQKFVSAAQIAAAQGDTQRAQDNYRKAVDIILAEADANLAGNLNVEAANFFRQAGDGAKTAGWHEEANQHYRKAIDTYVAEAQPHFDDGKNAEASTLIYRAALVSISAGWVQEGVELYERAAQGFNAAGDKAVAAQDFCEAFRAYRNAFRMYRGGHDSAKALAIDPNHPDEVESAMIATKNRLHELMGTAHDAMQSARAKCEDADSAE